MPVPILFRDQWLIVCEKPVGISSESPGLPDLLREELGRKVWPVHRLDQGTGGVSVLALSSAACTAVQRLFQQNLVEKEYCAVLTGRPETESGIFEDLLFYDRRTHKSYVVSQARKGVKQARCAWTLCGTVMEKDQALSLVRVFLHT